MDEAPAQMRAAVVEYCARIGEAPLLVQGAGGNVSWKDGETLWVKASGTWLAAAAREEIFVPVDLPLLRAAMDAGDFAVTPKVRGPSRLRPSMETLLHALMPQRVVVHVHAVEILAHLVRERCAEEVASRLGGDTRWAMVGYHKPGAELAAAIKGALERSSAAQVVFLQNHGVVVGGADVAEVDGVLRQVTSALATAPLDSVASRPAATPLAGYVRVADPAVQQLALDPRLFRRLSSCWALFPDHVVFLGPEPHVFETRESLGRRGELPALIFIEDDGVFVRPDFNEAMHAQLRCYYDVLARQPEDATIRTLTASQVAELLNWDAERYRMTLSRQRRGESP